VRAGDVAYLLSPLCGTLRGKEVCNVCLRVISLTLACSNLLSFMFYLWKLPSLQPTTDDERALQDAQRAAWQASLRAMILLVSVCDVVMMHAMLICLSVLHAMLICLQARSWSGVVALAVPASGLS
jgi:hypothetical protein